MSAPLTARDHALRVAALEAAAKAFTDAYEKARKEAEPVFAAKYTEEGNDRQMVLLPSGEKISYLTIKAAPVIVDAVEGQPEQWAADHIGDEAFEEYILPAAVTSKKVVAAVKAVHPELVKRRLRPATAKRLVEQAAKAGGWLQDEETDDKQHVATIRTGEVTGAFAFTGQDGEQRRARLMAELLAGRLRDVIGEVFGPQALPGGDTDA